ncbi:2-amino-4-deoxychorismate dehydrogenase [Sporotomaculum syntrophicum]|uniref:2-amino-4-deoxychorismate dehydrogenase n=1 Tax=Sporotomaculum syntrophicum TaxID=182264 RepID=A0A9D2WPW6_9FIRM|nr:flavodoxin family protein [Sporotomaculum syntrophicum]KAF1085395.1 2-amino-4-deoxychorismate dehydrogenase [Sporotomaculum syntrophicum]
MKVVAFNGSPNKEGNTYQAVKLVVDELEKEGIETEIVHVGGKSIRGCTACGKCIANKNEECVLPGDEVNEWIQKMKNADGIIFGAPVHYSSIGATMKAFLDRAFYVTGINNNMLRHKVAVGVVAVRRTGGIEAISQLNNYISYSEMIMPTSNYWNVIYGTKPGDALQDLEGVQIMRILGKNMAWLMKIIEHGKEVIKAPESERKIFMNFIR